MATTGIPLWPWAGSPPELLPVAGKAVLLAWQPVMDPLATESEAPSKVREAARSLGQIAHPIADLALHFGIAEDPAVSFREAKFLAACALVQRGQALPAKALLLKLLPCGLAQAALQAAQLLAQELRHVGLYLHNPWGKKTRRQ
jgi:hypothetical protein